MKSIVMLHARAVPAKGQRWLTFITAAVLVCSVWPGIATQKDPRTEPETALALATKLMESKDYAGFLKTFARPSELAELLAKRSLAEVAAEFGRERATDLLAALKAALMTEPTYNTDRTRVDYRFQKPFGRERAVTLVKIDAYWYLR